MKKKVMLISCGLLTLIIVIVSIFTVNKNINNLIFSPNATEMANAFYVSNSGSIGSAFAFSNPSLDSAIIRPCFYLNSNVLYSSGTGTSSNPIRIVV